MSNKNYSKYYQQQKVETAEEITTEVVEEVAEETVEEIVEEVAVEEPVEEVVVEPEPKEDLLIGTVVDCSRLRVRQHPNIKAEVLAELEVGSKVTIRKDVGSFYAISTDMIQHGYCMKKFIAVEQ